MIGLAVLSAVAFHGLSPVYSPQKAPMVTRPKGTPMVTMVETASSRSRRLNREAFNTRNMAIDERQAYEALMEKRAADSGRRNAILGLLAVGGAAGYFFLNPEPAAAVVGSTNPANNYYFPMAKYRYLPRIYRAYIACDVLALPALKEQDWDGLEIAWERMDDTITAMPLYTNAVEGSRSSKRKKKSAEQKGMYAATKKYATAVDKLYNAIKKRDADGVVASLASASKHMATYRTLAKIDTEDGGVIDPSSFASKSGSKVTGTGYVVPVFRGGATGVGVESSDFALR